MISALDFRMSWIGKIKRIRPMRDGIRKRQNRLSFSSRITSLQVRIVRAKNVHFQYSNFRQKIKRQNKNVAYFVYLHKTMPLLLCNLTHLPLYIMIPYFYSIINNFRAFGEEIFLNFTLSTFHFTLKKAALQSNIINLRKQPSSKKSSVVFLQKKLKKVEEI